MVSVSRVSKLFRSGGGGGVANSRNSGLGRDVSQLVDLSAAGCKPVAGTPTSQLEFSLSSIGALAINCEA